MKKSLMLILLLTSSLISSISMVSANAENSKTISEEESVIELITIYFDNYFESLKTLTIDSSANILKENDDTLLCNKWLEFQIEISKAFGTALKDYKYNIVFNEIYISQDNAKIKLKLDADFKYMNADDDTKSGMYNIIYEFKLKNENGQWFITKIESDLDDFKNFKGDVNIKVKKGINIKKAIIETTEEKLKDLNIMKFQFNEALEKAKIKEVSLIPNENAQNNSQDLATVTAAWYGYDKTRGVSYAERFAKATTNSRFFYTASNDCTNFVSQCVWAAYGGYVVGNDTASKNNIANKRRMVLNEWHGGTGGGTSNWESVVRFWNYTSYAGTMGPGAIGYNDNSSYKWLYPANMDRGEVLQVRNGIFNPYGHSVYITKMNSTHTSYSDIFVSQHSSDLLNRPLSTLIANFGGSSCMMRKLKFGNGYFNN